jgi:hypothetical protein
MFFSEAEFPFLDSKPEIDEYKPKVNKNKGGKKRSGQTYVLKQVVGQGQRGKAIGKVIYLFLKICLIKTNLL